MALDREMGRDVAFNTIRNAYMLGARYIANAGISISVGDLGVNDKVIKQKNELIKEAEKKTEEVIESYNDGTLEVIPGKTSEESRELKILQILNEVRAKISDVVKKEFPAENPISHMIKSGSGGNILNITQMACSVGQQDLEGKRIEIGFIDRTLPFFRKGDLSPRARGFINSSFIDGLKPDEFFFQAMTGRSSLMDTALRTPKSGYLYRRLARSPTEIEIPALAMYLAPSI